MKRINWLILAIVIFALIIRIVRLGSTPPHLTPDEASLGYNAYSILTTGKDEYGQILPVIFKSFGDYKPGLYVYTAVPTVAIFGLTEFSTRLPSALFGVVAVWLLYLIVKKLSEVLNLQGSKLALVAAFLLAINPWHIHFSRGAWEINVALTLTLAGVYFFLKALHNSKYIIVSCLFFALTLLTYQGAKLSTAIVLLVLAIIFWKKAIKFKPKHLIGGLVLGLIIVTPIIFSFFSGKTGRLSVFSVFSYPRPEQYLQQFLDQNNEIVGSAKYYLFHSEANNFVRGVLGRYFNYYSARFLFFEGDWQNPRHTSPHMGLFLAVDVVLFLSGIIYVIKNGNKISLFVLLWLLLAPLPAVLSRDQIHAVRSFNMVIPVVLINASGILFLMDVLKNRIRIKLLKYVLVAVFAMVYLGNYTYYLDSYFVHLPKHDSKYWDYGHKQVVQSVIKLQDKYENIYIQQSFAQPYIYFLFYGSASGREEYLPKNYQKQAKLVESKTGDVGQVEKTGKIQFVSFDWPKIRSDQGVLAVGDVVRIPDTEMNSGGAMLIEEIKFLDGLSAFRIVETDNE